MSNEEYYKDNDDEEESFSGFSIVNEQGVEIDRLKKILGEAVQQDDEPTIASVIPDNEAIVILDNASMLLPKSGSSLEIKFFEDNDVVKGSVYFQNKKIGDFKPAFLSRLFASRKGQFCKAVMHSDSPVMIKLLFSLTKSDDYIKEVASD